MNTDKVIMTVQEATESMRAKLRPAAAGCQRFIRDNPGVAGGVAAGYALGAGVERIPVVRALLGPLPRIAGAVAGAFFGQAFERAWQDVRQRSLSEAVAE